MYSLPDAPEITPEAVVMPRGWSAARAAQAVRDRWQHTLTGNHPSELLRRRSESLVDAFVYGLGRQGLTGRDVACGGRVDTEWLAAEISVVGDWRGLANDAYDFEDARDVARTLLAHLRNTASA